MLTSTMLPPLDAFSDQFGELVHNWGLKRIHGRIWSRLFLSNRPLDAADLIKQLDISKALVSISVRELLAIKAVKEAGRSERGTNLFRANENLQEVYFEVLKQREHRTLQETQRVLSTLSQLESDSLTSTDVSKDQIANLSRHLQSAISLVTAVVGPQPASQPTQQPKSDVASDSSQVVSINSSRRADDSQSFSSLVSGEALNVMVLPAHGG